MEKIMGNYSRDSFSETNALNYILKRRESAPVDPKQYVSVRVQQGKPVLDADLNETEDILRGEHEAVGMHFIGSGAPFGSDGFRIIASAAENDFWIEAGILLVYGSVVWNRARVTYRTQSNCLSQRQTPPLPTLPALPELSPPVEGNPPRYDLVYLDVWEREVTSTEDARLVDQRIGVETAVRLVREWVVRVCTGLEPNAVEIPQAVQEQLPGHSLYVLARISRSASKNRIDFDDLADLRRTDLTLSLGESPLRVYGATGVLQYDSEDFVSMCLAGQDAYGALLYSDLFLADNFETITAIESLTLGDAFHDVKAMFRLGEGDARRREFGVGGTLGVLGELQQVQKKFHDHIYPLASATTARVVTVHFLDQLNILLGERPEVVPGLRQALEERKVRDAIDAQLAINSFVGGRSGVTPKGRLSIRFLDGPPSTVPIIAPGMYRFVYEITSSVNMEETFDLDASVDGANDWTTSHEDTLRLGMGETAQLNVDVSIPAGTTNTSGKLVLRVRSHQNPAVIDFSNNDVYIALNALPPTVVPITIQLVSPAININEDIIAVGRGTHPGLPHQSVSAEIDVTNASNSSVNQDFTASFSLSVANIFEAIPDQPFQIAGGATHRVSITIEATLVAAEDARANLTVNITRKDEPSITKNMVVMLKVDKA